MNAYPPEFEICITVGPASCRPETMRRLLEAGARAFRFPFAKETPGWQLEHATMVRMIAAEVGVEATTVMDLPGGEPRTGNDAPVLLSSGQEVWLRLSPTAVMAGGLVSLGLTGAETLHGLLPGDLLLIGDGEVALSTIEMHDGAVRARALNAGIITPRRPITTSRSCGDALTPADIAFLSTLREHPFDRVMLSFARSASDVERLRSAMTEILGPSERLPQIEVKIETAEAVTDINAIAATADHLLIARGHLALHVGVLDFYAAQVAVITAARAASRPVHAGTQLLESVGTRWVPLRAELSDLSHLVAAGVDGILLAAETTIGADPVRTVDLARQIAQRYGSPM